MQNLSRVFIANRGEIAVRVIQACRELGIETVVAVSSSDKTSLPARMADRAVCIGPPQPSDSYLRVETIVTAARETGCQAVHPGYGFLAESPRLGQALQVNGLALIGPRPEHISAMGDKLTARRMATEVGIPLIPGSDLVGDETEARAAAEKVGYPLLLKAAAGGGGKGMKIVDSPARFATVYHEARGEARAAFNDDRLYLERVIVNARHIEVQILADNHGNAVHLFERDCSVQRRYQKVIEEAPSPVVTPEIRRQICRAALDIAKSIGYESAGTVEFVLDLDEKKFYFLEMNTRIQVEHPVTEMITGRDLVKEQLRIAAGETISFSQDEVTAGGHAIECRITAEKAEEDFRPSPGRIGRWRAPRGQGVRVDTHCFPGYLVPPYYDSLLAKVITHGPDRPQAVNRMQEALDDFEVDGIETTIGFLHSLLSHPDFAGSNINTRWLEHTLLS
jgi:acetyl-CoA carboxylase biotin carboxylase subunit